MRKTSSLFVVLSAAIPIAALISVTVGTADISVADTLRVLAASTGLGSFEGIADSSRIIIVNLRLPRIILALSSGASLAAAGAVLQGVFLNPMADPYVMGISSGAAFAVAIGIILGTSSQLALQAFALIGSAGAMVLVLVVAGLASRRGESTGMLLAGIAISVMLSSGVSLIMYMNHEQAERIIFWTFGSLSSSGWGKLSSALGFQIAGLALILLQWRDVNMLSQGDESARSLGLVPGRARVRLLLSASFVTAITVSVTGIIGFAGLMVPHVFRMLSGPDHRSLLPLSVLGGALFLMLADMFGRVLLSPAELPVGVITSMLGAPYLLYILISRRRGDVR